MALPGCTGFSDEAGGLLLCTGRQKELFREEQRRGHIVCVYVSISWCKQYAIRVTVCDPDLEPLCLSMRPFYLPREFGNIIICAAYILYLQVEMQ